MIHVSITQDPGTSGAHVLAIEDSGRPGGAFDTVLMAEELYAAATALTINNEWQLNRLCVKLLDEAGYEDRNAREYEYAIRCVRLAILAKIREYGGPAEVCQMHLRSSRGS